MISLKASGMHRATVIVEWAFSPANYFDEPMEIHRDGHVITISDGNIEARLDASAYDRNAALREQLHETLNNRFLAVQMLNHEPYELSGPTVRRLHPDGRRGVVVGIAAGSIAGPTGSLDIQTIDNEGNITSDSRRERVTYKNRLADLGEKHGADLVLHSLLGSFNTATRNPAGADLSERLIVIEPADADFSMESKNMPPAFTVLQTSIRLRGTAIAGAEDRQSKIAGFDQGMFSKAAVVCIGSGGLISHIAPTLVRKGIGRITLLDADIVEPSNLNRQRFYTKDLGKNKVVALAENLQRECIAATEIRGLPFRLEEAIARGINLPCDAAVCGVDNNPARTAASRLFRARDTPVVFTGVSRDGDHGYIFVQDRDGPCIGCLFPDMAGDDRYPCPGTPAIADVLQAVGAFAVYAVDTLLMKRRRAWNYRRITLSDGATDGVSKIAARPGCRMFSPAAH